MVQSLAIATLFILAYMYRQTSPDDRLQIASIALVCGGAVGNLIDRLRSPRGVVDFIDIGVGTHRFWTFNIADVGVTLGTAILTWILCVRVSRDERRRFDGNPGSRGARTSRISRPSCPKIAMLELCPGFSFLVGIDPVHGLVHRGRRFAKPGRDELQLPG